MVLHNPNNWHWVNKDASVWAKQWLGDTVKDIKAEYDRLVRAGVTFTRAPKNFGKMRAAYGKDPDGNILELLEEGPGMEKWSRRDFVRVSLVDDEGTRDSRHLMAP